MSRLLNDGSAAEPKLRVFLNLETLKDLRAGTAWPGLQGQRCFERLRGDGFDGVQLTSDEPLTLDTLMPHCGHDRIDTPLEADRIATKHAKRGDLCLTVHAGSGLENDDDSFRLVEAILRASDEHRLPIFLETHRATITQDLWRTVQIAKTFPEVRFNGDFSHYYCGQELVYGDWEAKLEFMKPIFTRVGFMHGRIASPGCMQVPINNPNERPMQAHGVVNYLDDFKELWTRAMLGFLGQAKEGDVLVFAPELLSGSHYYARLFPDADGRLVEESDRYTQALLLRDLAHSFFAEAYRRLRSSQTKA